MSDNNFPACARRAGIFRRWNNNTKTAEIKTIGFHCGKKSCPVCRGRRRSYLLKRLNAAEFTKNVVFWTITTDPKILDPGAALESMSRRWHVVHRSLIRLAPNLRYFRVIEFTKSGLPHMHFITDSFINWHSFRRLLVNQDFGNVLHFKLLPKRVAIGYATKYITKAIYDLECPSDFRGRLWSASLGFLPIISYSDGEGNWDLLWIDHADERVLFMEKSYRLHYTNSSPPDYPWGYPSPRT
jgi:hypothetical protein